MSTEFEELERLIAEKTGAPICPVCGTPYIPYNSRQKTCGTEECKREWKNKYLRDRRRRLQEEDYEAYRDYCNEAQRKARRKKRLEETLDEGWAEIEEKYRRMEERDKTVFADGLNYGKRQMERTLALVPKIDVNMDRRQKDDDIHDKDE